MPTVLTSFRLAIIALASALLLACTQQAPVTDSSDGAVSFALVGDLPYGAAQVRGVDALIADVNGDAQVRFVLHLGDIKAGSERCDDALIVSRYRQIQNFRAAVIYTPGDNEWTDCHRSTNGSYLPTERLAFVRSIFFPQPGQSGGQRPIQVLSQASVPGYASFVENSLFVRNRVVFATVHIVGSNNNLAPWNGIDASDSVSSPRPDRLAEFQQRQAAAVAWIDKAFDEAVARDAAGVLLAFQANPEFERSTSDPLRAGFNQVLARIKQRALAYGKPVVVAHGDNHEFVVDLPLSRDAEPAPRLRQFTRVQGFGSPRLHWVKVTADPKSANVFSFEPRWVPGNP